MHPTKPSSWAPGDPPGGVDWTGGSGRCRGLPRSPADVAGVFGLWYSCGLRTARISWIHLSAAGSWCVTAASHPPFQVYLMTRTLALTHAHTHHKKIVYLCICAFLCASEKFPVVIVCRVASFSLIHIVVLCFLGYSILLYMHRDMCTLNTSKRIVIVVIKPRFLLGVLLRCGKPYLLHGHSLFWSH